MTVVSMRELLLRGESGSIALGSPTQEVLASLGEPTDRSRIKPSILKYGSLELAFRGDRLVLATYHAGRPGADERVVLDLPRTIGEIEELLRDEGLEFSTNQELSYDNQYALNVRSGAVVLFVDGALSSVQVAG